MKTKLNLQNHDQHRLAQHPNYKDQRKFRQKVCVEILTIERLAEGVFATQFEVVEEFPPVVELEGVEFPSAASRLGPPVLAVPLCFTTTQLPKPDPEINCYESRQIRGKKRLHVG